MKWLKRKKVTVRQDTVIARSLPGPVRGRGGGGLEAEAGVGVV